MCRHALATAIVGVALAQPGTALAQSVAGPENANASCTAHFVHGVPGPPGQFRREFGSDFPFGVFGAIVSGIARAEGATAEECAGIEP